MKKIIIITGGSKGIGKGIIEAYQRNGYKVFSVARTEGKFEDGQEITQFKADLSNERTVREVLSPILKQLDPLKIERIVLINNAGTLGEIGRIENLDTEKISAAIQLNTVTPILLTSTFLALTKGWVCEKKIINISSGAAQTPYYGWAIYCATKAALDMMTKVVAVEQQVIKNGAKIIAIYPGVVDTDMQTEIRKQNKEDFAAIDRFLELKASGSLASSKTIGEKIFLLDQQALENGSILRIE